MIRFENPLRTWWKARRRVRPPKFRCSVFLDPSINPSSFSVMSQDAKLDRGPLGEVILRFPPFIQVYLFGIGLCLLGSDGADYWEEVLDGM